MLIARRRRLRTAGIVALLLMAASIVLDHTGAFGRGSGRDWQRFDRKRFIVTRVIDGDTIHVAPEINPSGENTAVRLVGVDAPEMNFDSLEPSAHWADRARNYLIARTKGRVLLLRLEPTQTRDAQNRVLAYVYVTDTDCLNLDMLRDGQAYADRRMRHSFRGQFEGAENDARKKKRGMWKELTDEQMPAWRRDWLAGRGKGRVER